MRLRNDPNAELKLEKSGLLISSEKINLSENTIIEIGMGKGEMITKLAQQNPDKQFIGIEKYATVAARAAKEALDKKLNNFFILNEDLAKLPDRFVGKVKTIWLTFSDPWPKAKHEKRRLTYKTFLEIYKKILDEDGVIKFKTDNDKLFEYSLESFSENGFILSNVTRNFHNHPSSFENVMTGYEQKWSSKGKNINYLEARLK